MTNERTHLMASKDDAANGCSSRENRTDSLRFVNLLPSPASTSDPTPKEYNAFGSESVPFMDVHEGQQTKETPPRISSVNSLDISTYGYDSQDSSPGAKRLLKDKRSDSKAKITFVCLVALAVAVTITAAVIHRGSSGTNSDVVDHNEIKIEETAGPLSILHPAKDLNVLSYTRGFATQLHVQIYDEVSPGLKSGEVKHKAKGGRIPTNAWYENLLLYPPGQSQPGAEQRVYAMPYIIDAIGPVPGVRLHQSSRQGGNLVIQMIVDESASLTLGMNTDLAIENSKTPLSHMYQLDDSEGSAHSALSLNLKWTGNSASGSSKDATVGSVQRMESTIARGMAYGTMKYIFNNNNVNHVRDINPHEDTILPTIFSQNSLLSDPLIDNDREQRMTCSQNATNSTIYRVEKEVQMSFYGSDFTWLAFFSHPVHLRCVEGNGVQFQVVDLPTYPPPARDADGSPILFIRVALVDKCTTGANAAFCTNRQQTNQGIVERFKALIRKHKNVFPGKNVRMEHSFELRSNDDTKVSAERNMKALSSAGNPPSIANVEFNWDAQNMYSTQGDSTGMLMFALSHHFDQMVPSSGSRVGDNSFCEVTLIGPVCPIESSKWILQEKLSYLSFRAPRPPSHEAIPDLVEALNKDIHYRVPEYFMKGVGDTYFSGKILAKVGRILLIAEELRELQQSVWIERKESQSLRNNPVKIPVEVEEEARRSSKALRHLKLPDEETFTATLDHLRSGVEVWLNGTAGAPFVYDTVWGGMVNCGCWFNEKTWTCRNRFPNCPAFGDAGLNFGNGFYNDHHFHYGYHIFAAAVVAHFDPEWGKKYYQEVLLLVRDIANPSVEDDSFPIFRHKDWYQGNSWASGIVIPPLLNGRNQESSSEAIAAYESIGLYGEVMAKVWETSEVYVEENYLSALRVRDVGRLLTSTELRAADRYWHVRKHGGVYPDNYAEAVIGMLWSTMAQFQTFFGGKPFLACGIQLLPLTPIAEERDNYDWIKTLYPTYAQTCEADPSCVEQGWSILQYAILATIGHKDEALKQALTIPSSAYESAGGNGHSVTNTLWYIATRPNNPPAPTEIQQSNRQPEGPPGAVPPPPVTKVTCGCEKSCTSEVLATVADGHSCGDRMRWLMNVRHATEMDACLEISTKEYPDECGKCNPSLCDTTDVKDASSEEKKLGKKEPSPPSPHPTLPPSPLPTLPPPPRVAELTCGCDKSCTSEVLATVAGGYSCGDRMRWLMNVRHATEMDACLEISTKEYPDECGKCNPSLCDTTDVKDDST